MNIRPTSAESAPVSHSEDIVLGLTHTTLADIVAIANGASVRLDPAALEAMRRSHALVERALTSGQAVYGLTTGVGDLYTASIRPEDVSKAQMNMLRSHASGVGAPLSIQEIRAIMATMLKSLLQGCSGVSPALAVTLCQMLNGGVTPWSPRGGSVGYLIATAHIGLSLFGAGQSWVDGELLPGDKALERAGIIIRSPGPREGHALLSGTYEITGIGVLALDGARRMADIADIAGAMSLEALRGNTRGFDMRVQAMRPHPGQTNTAQRLLSLLHGSEVLEANKTHRLQDALSLRCLPQVHGAVRDSISYCISVLETEINSVTDNPSFVIENDELVALPNGNGHGAPTSLALDYLAIAIAAVSTMSQVRADRLTSHHLSGLPAFLANGEGFNSGFMIPPYVSAALGTENRLLAAPATVHTVSTCAGQEDHVSMGVTAARKACKAIDNAFDILSIELLCAAEALEFQRPLRAGRGTEAAYATIRSRVSSRKTDRDMYPDLAAIRKLINDGDFLSAVENALTPDIF